jgi:hypothetical protein
LPSAAERERERERERSCDAAMAAEQLGDMDDSCYRVNECNIPPNRLLGVKKGERDVYVHIYSIRSHVIKVPPEVSSEGGDHGLLQRCQ